MNNKFILILSVIMFFFQACREEFFLDSSNNEKLLVVEGFITNKTGPYTIKLSQSSQTDKPQTIPLSNCIVTLEDNSGAFEVLTEVIPGEYMTSEGGFLGIIGSKYSLSVVTENGEEYRTDFQEMRDIVGIDSLYTKLIYTQDLEYSLGLPGYEFYVDTEVGLNKENYFFWNMTETFEYDTDYRLAYVETLFGGIIYFNPRYDTLITCWNTNDVKSFTTGTTRNLNNNQIMGKPLYFVGTDSKRLSKKYSVLVKQFNIDEQAYNYWQNIEEQISDQNFLTTTQPYTNKGNLININNPDEIVLGYFTVASVSEKRIFVERPRAPFYYPSCIVITDSDAIRDYKEVHSPPYYYVEVEDGVFGLVYERCLDCRTKGGKLKKPDFWAY